MIVPDGVSISWTVYLSWVLAMRNVAFMCWLSAWTVLTLPPSAANASDGADNTAMAISVCCNSDFIAQSFILAIDAPLANRLACTHPRRSELEVQHISMAYSNRL